MLIDALRLSLLRHESLEPKADPLDSLRQLLGHSARQVEFSVHALAAVRIRFAMLLLPDLDDDLSYNGRCTVTIRYLSDLGLREDTDFDSEDVDQILQTATYLKEASRGGRKSSWSDLHYVDKHDLLEKQNRRCGLCGRPLEIGGSPSSSALPTLDHIVPFALGGNRKDNLRLICKSCNSTKGMNLTFANSDRVAMNYFIKYPTSGHPKEVVLWVLERDRSQCTEKDCPHTSKTSKLGVVKIYSRGREIYDNLRTVCEDCAPDDRLP